MKMNHKRHAAVALIALLLVAMLSMTSCSFLFTVLDDGLLFEESLSVDSASAEESNIPDESVTAETERESDEADPTDDEPAGETVVNNVVISGGNVSDISRAATSGLRSAVSVYCTFTRTVNNNSFWFGSGGTSEQTYSSAGSGVIYELDTTGSAFVITNYHVVYDSSSNTENRISDSIKLFLYGMESTDYAIPATYVGGSMNYDIAVLRVDKNEILRDAAKRGSAVAARFADSDKTQVGETAIAVGNPKAGGISVTTGIVSVDSEHITMTAIDGRSQVSFRVVRIDTAVNSGNSGGGLYNGKGELIGIVNAKITRSDVENIGYAIPSNIVRGIADNIIDYCYNKDCETVMRGLLGITVQPSARTTVYDPETGMLSRYEQVSVSEVTAGGLGEKILKKGDVVESITIGERTVVVTRQYHLIDAMLDVRIGDTVEMQVIRDGKEMTVSTTITEECLSAY